VAAASATVAKAAAAAGSSSSRTKPWRAPVVKGVRHAASEIPALYNLQGLEEACFRMKPITISRRHR